MSILQLSLAILPGLLMVFFIYRADRYEKEDILPLSICFLIGILTTIPIMEVQRYFDRLGLDNPNSISSTLFSSFILVALTEEGIKFAALRLYPYNCKFFNEPIDGIVYAMMIGMGFATLENILYAYQYDISTTLVRGFTAMPAHACFAVIMGYFFGKARFATARKKRLLLFGLLFPVGIHGLYDFFIIQEVYDGLIMLALAILSISIFFAIKLVREQQENSPFKPANEDDQRPTDSI